MRRKSLGKYSAKLMSFLLCGSMMVANVVPAAASKKKEDKNDKVETVYVNANAEGDTDKITVSEQLKNTGDDSLEDYSNLKNIKNVKGDEEYTQNSDGSLTWTNAGDDIYYQGESDAELPVSVKVTYYLDGKKIAPGDLAGKSGKVKIRFDYTNNTKQTVKVDKKDVTVQTPFTIISAMILPSDNFSNIEVENGRTVSDGDRNVVIGLAMPGLSDSLKLSDYDKLSDIDIPEYVEVTADATDFELSMTATMATTGTINDIDLDEIDDLDELKEDMDKLTDASSELKDGTGKLLEGMNTLDTSLRTYTKGVSAVDKGAGQLKDGLEKVASNKKAFEKGAESLTDGLKTLKNGTRTLKKGVSDYTSGASTLEKGIQNASSGSAALKSGAGSLYKGLKSYTDGAAQIQSGLSAINDELSKVKMPSGEEMETVSDAAGRLESDAKKLQEQADKLSSLIGSLSKLEELKSNYENEIKDKWAPTAITKTSASASQQATQQAETKLEAQRDKAKTAAQSAISEANEKGNARNEQLKAVQSLVEELDVIDGDGGGDISKEARNKLLAAIGDTSSVNVSTDISIEEVSPKIQVSTEDAMKEALGDFPKLSLSAPSIDAGALGTLLQDMSEQAKILESFSSNIGGLTKKIPALQSGIKDLNSGAAKLTKNSDDLVDGAKQLSKGLDSLSSGLDALEAGAKKLTANNKSLTGGSDSLDEGAGKLLSGSKKLEKAVKKVTKAADLLATGSVQLKSGTGKLASAGGDINSGVGKLVDGVDKLNDGFIEFDEEGIQKLADLAGDDLDTVTTQLKAVKEADKNYQSYGGIKDGAKGSVKFIIETAAIEKDDD